MWQEGSDRPVTAWTPTDSATMDWGALMGYEKKPGRNTTWPLGRNSRIESTGYSIYFPVDAGAGATTSLCCAQAPSSKPVTKTATIIIIFRNFNLSRLLSSQVAPFRLAGELRP